MADHKTAAMTTVPLPDSRLSGGHHPKTTNTVQDFDAPAKQKLNKYALLCSFLASITAVLLGYDIGVMSGAALYIQKDLNISDVQVEILVGVINIYCLLGAGLAGKTSDWIGRRYTLVFASGILFVGAILMGFATNYTFLMIGRFIAGIGVGYGLMVAPVYTAEVAPVSARGFLTSFIEVFANFDYEQEILSLCVELSFGIPMFTISGSCHACTRVFSDDSFGDHAVSCPGVVGVKHRHNLVWDTLYDICYRLGITIGREVDIGLTAEVGGAMRPADLLLYKWERGKDTCVDVTGSSPLTQSGLAGFTPGRVVAEAAQRKRDKYGALCVAAGYEFLPFSFSTFGELDVDPICLLRRIQSVASSQDEGLGVFYLFSRIGFAIARGVGAQLVSRLPTNFL